MNYAGRVMTDFEVAASEALFAALLEGIRSLGAFPT
jgi:hypothetical protein